MTAFYPEGVEGEGTAQAVLLWRTMRAARYALGKRMPRSWIGHFKTLVETYGRDEVDEVLAWFCEHHKDQYCPKVVLAGSFRVNYGRIKAAMGRDVEEVPAVAPRCQAFADKCLGEWTLPAYVAAALPQIVQKTADNWKKFCDLLDGRLGGCVDKSRDMGFLSNVLVRCEAGFVEEWLHTAVQDRFLHYSDGPPVPVHSLWFAPDRQLFRDHFWRSWSQYWCGSATAFDALLDKLKGET